MRNALLHEVVDELSWVLDLPIAADGTLLTPTLDITISVATQRESYTKEDVYSIALNGSLKHRRPTVLIEQRKEGALLP